MSSTRNTAHRRALLLAGLSFWIGTEALAIPVDIVILLDESGSVNNDVFAAQKQAAQDIVNSLTFGPTDTAVGIAAFAGAARTIVGFSQNRLSLINALNGTIQASGMSCLPCAFDYATSQFADFGRAGVPDLTVIFTDGVNNVNSSSFAASLTALHAESFVVVGILSPSDDDIIDQIASNGSPYLPTSFLIGDFGNTREILLSMDTIIQQLSPDLTSVPEPGTLTLLIGGLAALGFGRRKGTG